MKNKKIIYLLCLIPILVSYLIIGEYLDIYIPCPIHEIMGLYCPGCGVTRMLLSILKLDFYSAFHYNQLVFILMSGGIFLFINYIYAIIKNKKPLYQKINNKVWIALIIILLVYGVLRNIYPVLAPLD